MPQIASNILPQEQIIPFMMADEFAYRVGQQMLPMLTSGVVTPEQIPQFMVADRLAQYNGMHTNFLPLAATGALGEADLLPFMAGDYLSHELPRHVYPRTYGARAAPRRVYRKVAEASAESN